ncbi:MAG: tetratricopeptide repeat protein [Caldilineales bacterium]|nr:tetratricopeptide repeat protein [Caldilineales bacterium]
MSSSTSSLSFGRFLRQLRRRAGMTQADLAAAVGYSASFISNLEKEARQPDLEIVTQRFVPALALQDEPRLAARLIELAMLARGMHPPMARSMTCKTQWVEVEDRQNLAGHIPVTPTPLIGRDSDVDWVCKRMLGHHGRLITLLGPPGVGKTRLALQTAHLLQAIYADGARFVALDTVEDPDLVPLTIAAELGLDDVGAKDPQQQIIAHLRRKEMLLVLDNFEQILPAASSVAELLAACPGLRIIVTSRERLHLRAEQRYHVTPLPVADAAALFIQIATAIDPDFELAGTHTPLLQELCLELDCLPLALELAAAHIEHLDLRTLLERLRTQRLDVLAGGPGDLPSRQQALRTAIAYSYDRLEASEQSLFRRLGVFAGGFDQLAIRTLGGDDADLISLIHKHLALRQSDVTTPRYQILETLRVFALERLTENGELARSRHQHSAYFLARVEQAQPALYGPEQTIWFHRLAEENNNLRAAIQYALDSEDLPTAARMCIALRHFWTMQSRLEEGRVWLDRILENPGFSQLSLVLQVGLFNSRGTIAYYQQDYAEAQIRFQAALRIAQTIDDHWGMAFALDGLGAEAVSRAAFSEADQFSEHSLAISQEHGFDWLCAITTINLGEIARMQGDEATATAHYEESLAVLRSVGDSTFIAVTLVNLAQLAISAGRWQRASELAGESLQLGMRAEQPRIIAASLDRLAAVAVHKEEPRLAGVLFGAAQRLRSDRGIQIQPADQRDYSQLDDLASGGDGTAGFIEGFQEGRRRSLSDSVAIALGDSLFN